MGSRSILGDLQSTRSTRFPRCPTEPGCPRGLFQPLHLRVGVQRVRRTAREAAQHLPADLGIRGDTGPTRLPARRVGCSPSAGTKEYRHSTAIGPSREKMVTGLNTTRARCDHLAPCPPTVAVRRPSMSHCCYTKSVSPSMANTKRRGISGPRCPARTTSRCFKARSFSRKWLLLRATSSIGVDFRARAVGSRADSREAGEHAPDGRVELHFEGKHVIFPGQATLLSWQPRVTVEAPR